MTTFKASPFRQLSFVNAFPAMTSAFKKICIIQTVEAGFQCWQLAEDIAGNQSTLEKKNEPILTTQNIKIP